MTDLLPAIPDALGVATDPGHAVVAMLERAKVWLTQACDLEDLCEVKSRAEAIRVYTVQKELGHDAELSAAEIVRRAERRIDQLVAEGQDRGEIASQLTSRPRGDDYDYPTSPSEFIPSGGNTRSQYRTLGRETPDEQFEEAVDKARAEDNLSRANVARKIKETPTPPVERSEWHHRKRHINPDRVATVTAQTLAGLVDGIALIDPADVSDAVAAALVDSIEASLKVLNRFKKELCRGR